MLQGDNHDEGFAYVIQNNIFTVNPNATEDDFRQVRRAWQIEHTFA